MPMIRIAARAGLAVAACLAVWIAAASGQQPAARVARFAAGELLVKFHPQASTTRRNNVIAGPWTSRPGTSGRLKEYCCTRPTLAHASK